MGGSLDKEDAAMHLGNLVEIGKLNLLAFDALCFEKLQHLTKGTQDFCVRFLQPNGIKSDLFHASAAAALVITKRCP